MARPRKASPANFNVQTNLNITHLAFAGAKYFKEGRYNAIKSVSTLVRTIVEDWIELQGGNKITSLDNAKEILAKLGMPFERTERTTSRGYYGNTYEDEEQADAREEAELKIVSELEKQIIEKSTEISPNMLEKAMRAAAFMNNASEEELEQLMKGKK